MTNPYRQSGSSLVSVLVASAILGIFALVMAQLLGDGFKGQSSMSLNADREVLKRQLVSAVSCSDTLTPTACPSAVPVRLIRRHKNGTLTTLVGSSGTRIGKWTVRAQCNATNDGLIVKATHIRPTASTMTTNAADFLPDPLTTKTSPGMTPRRCCSAAASSYARAARPG